MLKIIKQIDVSSIYREINAIKQTLQESRSLNDIKQINSRSKFGSSDDGFPIGLPESVLNLASLDESRHELIENFSMLFYAAPWHIDDWQYTDSRGYKRKAVFIHCTLSGEAVIQTKMATLHVKAGDVWVMSPKAMHRVKSTSECMTMGWTHAFDVYKGS